jgi:excisionase family DNA binding protein
MGQVQNAPLLTLEEVAGRLRVSKTTVRKWMKLHKILPIKLGRRTLFTEAEICRWIETLEGYARRQQINDLEERRRKRYESL